MLFEGLTFGSLLAAAGLVDAAAPLLTNNAPGVGYKAELSAGPGPVVGSIEIKSAPNDTGVQVELSWTGFDLTDSREYSYHIHQMRVPDNGNCSGTQSHFDQYGVTDDFRCDPSKPDLCQLGDLSGKHGTISLPDDSSGSVSLSYHEGYLSTSPGDTAFFGNLSIVLHRKRDKFRVKCGNFVSVSDTANPATSSNATSTFVDTSIVTGSATGPTQTSTNVVTATDTQPSVSSTEAAVSSSSGVRGVSAGFTTGIGQRLFAMVVGMASLIGFA